MCVKGLHDAFISDDAALPARGRRDLRYDLYRDRDRRTDQSSYGSPDVLIHRLMICGTWYDSHRHRTIGDFYDLVAEDDVHETVHRTVEFQVVYTSLRERKIGRVSACDP